MLKSMTFRWKIWVACFAVLVNALAPSISHAIAASRGEPGLEICRSGDSLGKPVSPALLAAIASAALEQDPSAMDAAMADCGYCLSHAGSYLILPDAPFRMALLEGHALRPFLFYHAPAPLPLLTAAPPRGPPAA
jgi:hypothetical protein